MIYVCCFNIPICNADIRQYNTAIISEHSAEPETPDTCLQTQGTGKHGNCSMPAGSSIRPLGQEVLRNIAWGSY